MLPLAEIRRTVDAYALISRYTKLRRFRGVATGLCPIHGEKTPSFRLNLSGPHAGLWKCYGCGARGDALDFLMAVDGIPLAEAAKRLASEFGIVVPDFRPETGPERAKRLRSESERDFCRWWWRQQWKTVRRLLDREMSRLELDFEFCECLGMMLRFCEASWQSDETICRERATPEDRRRYRIWQQGQRERREALWAFIGDLASTQF
jgi:DNA primase